MLSQWAHNSGLFGAWPERETYSFKRETDPKLAKFFQEWYGRSGNHRVFCTDLEWLDSLEMAAARQALAQLGTRLNVYLVETKGAACADIRNRGGLIHLVPKGAMGERAPRMSIIEDGDSQIAAIRFKNAPGDRVQFRRTADNTVLSLAHAYIFAASPEPPIDSGSAILVIDS